MTPSPPSNPNLSCEVCGRTARGRHYGVAACRACAAFFRRNGGSECVKKCKWKSQGEVCELLKDGYFKCKTCRLERCFQVGMSAEGFQFDRDKIHAGDGWQVAIQHKNIPQTLSTFIGRPNFIIFCAPSSSSNSKNYIDVQFLLDKAMSVLERGIETPLISKTNLGKLAIGVQRVHAMKLPDPRLIDRCGKDDILANWEIEMLKATTWLSYFDDFRRLPVELQLQLLKGVWQVWNRLELLVMSVIMMKREFSERRLRNMEKDSVLGDWSHMDIDMSWCTNYTTEELKFFIDIQTDIKYDELFRLMFELEPTDVELSYMLCQLCFHYVGKRYQGRILDVSERFLELIGDELHSYYVDELKRPCYGGRVASMMKINNRIQEKIFTSRSRRELAVVFDVFNLEFSHPEMFVDL